MKELHTSTYMLISHKHFSLLTNTVFNSLPMLQQGLEIYFSVNSCRNVDSIPKQFFTTIHWCALMQT